MHIILNFKLILYNIHEVFNYIFNDYVARLERQLQDILRKQLTS